MFGLKNKTYETDDLMEDVFLEEEVTKEDIEKKKKDIFSEMIQEYTVTKQQPLVDIRRGILSKEDFLKDVKNNFLKKYYNDYEDTFDDLINQFEEFLFGYYVLTPLVDDPDISDIAVLTYDNIRIKRKGKNSGVDIKFEDKKKYEAFVKYVASKNEVDISNINSIQIFTDRINCKDFILRFVIVMPLLTSTGTPYLCIRKIPKNFPELDDLVKEKMLTEEQKEYYIERFRKGSILICGPSACGKTTFLNALKETISYDSSCMVTQETEELSQKNHPYMFFEHPITNRGEGKVKYSLYDIVAAGLLMNVAYFIIGEIKGAEASYLLNAAYTGHICATTIHAEDAENALDKLADYAKYGSDYKKEELMKMLTAFKTVVFLKDYKVVETYEVEKWDEENKKPVYKKVDFN